MKNILIISLGVLILALSACAKEGEGGAATIEGKVMVRLINENTLDTLATYEALDERVYIVYGDADVYGDDVRTTYNGNYQFDYLYQGDYTVYAYSECLFNLVDCPGETSTVLKEVNISSSRETVTVPTLTINKYTK